MNTLRNKTREKTVGIFFVFLLFTIFYPLSTSAATLYFYPQNISLVPGEEVLVDLRMDTEGEAVNAIELEGALSGVVATLRGIDNSGSAIDVFVERPSITGKSDFRLVGGIPAGLTGEHLLARIALRAELPGQAKLALTPAATRILLADGSGKEVQIKLIDTLIQVSPKSRDYLAISSESHPDQNQWYAADSAQMRFDFDPKASYSYVVTHDPTENPDEVADQPEGAARFEGVVKLKGLPEGALYFAVKKVGSSAVSRYRLMNDMTSPEWVEVNKNEGVVETEGKPFLTFLAGDAVSGVEYYEMRVDSDDAFTVVSPQTFPDEYRVLSIRAYDRAGNFIEKFIPGPKKDYSLWVWVVVLFVLVVWMSGIIKKR